MFRYKISGKTELMQDNLALRGKQLRFSPANPFPSPSQLFPFTQSTLPLHPVNSSPSPSQLFSFTQSTLPLHPVNSSPSPSQLHPFKQPTPSLHPANPSLETWTRGAAQV
ncbi:hypothetical protein Pmani_023103 [Petrolisthes manimaculis]|uniref:Uncharacterized protein n=1 Tax=Petrolisthes manimaculis TaxID=1843537 RepID=A0AAE1PBQ3_9EUCA|nr:hypothetical protein Pmani_023103 [Petrolisthes manimaculis]